MDLGLRKLQECIGVVDGFCKNIEWTAVPVQQGVIVVLAK